MRAPPVTDVRAEGTVTSSSEGLNDASPGACGESWRTGGATMRAGSPWNLREVQPEEPSAASRRIQTWPVLSLALERIMAAPP